MYGKSEEVEEEKPKVEVDKGRWQKHVERVLSGTSSRTNGYG